MVLSAQWGHYVTWRTWQRALKWFTREWEPRFSNLGQGSFYTPSGQQPAPGTARRLWGVGKSAAMLKTESIPGSFILIVRPEPLRKSKKKMRCFSNFAVPMNPLGHLVKMQFLTLEVWGGTWDSAFLSSAQVTTVLLVCEPHFWSGSEVSLLANFCTLSAVVDHACPLQSTSKNCGSGFLISGETGDSQVGSA